MMKSLDNKLKWYLNIISPTNILLTDAWWGHNLMIYHKHAAVTDEVCHFGCLKYSRSLVCFTSFQSTNALILMKYLINRIYINSFSQYKWRLVTTHVFWSQKVQRRCKWWLEGSRLFLLWGLYKAEHLAREPENPDALPLWRLEKLTEELSLTQITPRFPW